MKKTTWKWDKWQQEILDYEGNILLHAGRQVGKSEVIAEKIKLVMNKYPGIRILIIAAAERQASEIFEKTRFILEQDKSLEFEVPPTKAKLKLTNQSFLMNLPAGRTGYFIRSFTFDIIIGDEAAYIAEMVWTSTTPMIAISESTRGFGWVWLLSTPFGKGGYFHDCSMDSDFRTWHASAEDCPRWSKKALDKERRKMTKVEYRQEICGEFVDDYYQFFPTKLIKKCMEEMIEWNKEKDSRANSSFYCGIDLAGYGGDENAFAICELLGIKLKIVKKLTTERVNSIETINQTGRLDYVYKFRKIFTDDASVGSPITDALKAKLGRKVIGLNNSSKRVKEQGEEIKKGILKEDLYANMLMLMETGNLSIINDPDIMRSMKGITFRYNDPDKRNSKNVHIYGKYSHITEAMVRACWCIKERGLGLFVY